MNDQQGSRETVTGVLSQKAAIMAEARANDETTRPSSAASRLAIAAMLVVAVAAAVYAIWHLRGLSRRSVEYFGSSAGQLILQAAHIEAWRLKPADQLDAASTLETISGEGAKLGIIERRDVSEAPGITNVRRGLMNDASYDWDASNAESPQWSHALRFSDGNHQATLLFSHNPPQAMLSGSQQRLSTRPVAAGLQAFFSDQFAK